MIMMKQLLHWVLYPFLLKFTTNQFTLRTPNCRTLSGDPEFPNKTELDNFNHSIDGRLLKVVPSAQFCKGLPGGNCSDAEWNDESFMKTIPGAMVMINWEQDYTSNPPSLCFRNTTTCGQGNVPVFGVNATSVENIQAGVLFAKQHNLKVVMKASGHDLLGRSTARGSFLIWTRYMQNVTFHDTFQVGETDMGSAVTVGSGVDLQTLYGLAMEKGQIFVGGIAPGVVPSGGYVQGAGHSPLGPLLGLAADNALQFEIVVADGTHLTVNSVSHPDLFWALRGGGAGSWGVIINTTFRVYPSFNGTFHAMQMQLSNSSQASQLADLHARHIFDWDPFRAGQYFLSTVAPPPAEPSYTWTVITLFPRTTMADAIGALQPFVDGVKNLGLTPTILATKEGDVNELIQLVMAADSYSGGEAIMGTRLIPEAVYRHKADLVGQAYTKLYDSGVSVIFGSLVAGGQVSENQNIDSAVHPKWRTAKTHLMIILNWEDTTSPEEVERIKQDMTQNKVPILANLAGGEDSAAYSNEADVREPDFQTTFFGRDNYAKLLSIKSKYDPDGMFIVSAGVGSEFFDSEGVCRKAV